MVEPKQAEPDNLAAEAAAEPQAEDRPALNPTLIIEEMAQRQEDMAKEV